MTHPNKLAAKVAAYNRAHAEANRLQLLYIEALRPFVGKKVLTQSGLAAKVKEALAPLDDSKPDFRTTGFHIWREAGDSYSLRWSLWVTEQYESGPRGPSTVQGEASFYAGELGRHDGAGGQWFGPTDTLVKVIGDDEPLIVPLPTNYTVEGIQAARARVVETKKAYDAAKSWANLGPFGEWDN